MTLHGSGRGPGTIRHGLAWGLTPLHAAAFGHGRVLSALLLHGAEVDARAHKGFSPMMLAAAVGVACLMCKLCWPPARASVDVASNKRHTSLAWATIEDHLSVVENFVGIGRR